jgi:hypothetical protein
MAEAS